MPANEKLNVACIGVGGMGWGDLHSLAASPHVRIAALCDVDATCLEKAAQEFPDAARFADWGELLAESGVGGRATIDAVSVSIPDHMHAAVALTAIRRGKHVYCQKPLTHDLYEARQLTRAARKAGVVTQMGIQIASTQGERAAVQLLRVGAIGKIGLVFLWSNKPAGEHRPLGPRPPTEDEVPPTLKWDNWLGTAPVRPFVKGIYHPGNWRGWQDFGTGWLGDMGCHIVNPVYTALKLPPPRSIRAEVEPKWTVWPARRAETYPQWQIVTWEFADVELAIDSTLLVRWMDGGKFPPDDLLPRIEAEKWQPQGGLYIGEEGYLLLPHEGGPQLYPREKFAGYPRPKVPPRDHYLTWVDACRGVGQANAPFDHAGPLTEIVLLGSIAARCPEQALTWNAAELKFANAPEANRLVRRTYRKGWEVPELA